jgi:hypothetical protein
MSSVEFARLKMAGNTQQKKNCTKGWSCGYTCLGQDKKTCKSPLQGQVAKYADWLQQQAGSPNPKQPPPPPPSTIAPTKKANPQPPPPPPSAAVPTKKATPQKPSAAGSNEVIDSSNYSQIQDELDSWRKNIDEAVKKDPNNQLLKASQNAVSGIVELGPFFGKTLVIRDSNGKITSAARFSEGDNGDAISIGFLASDPQGLIDPAKKVRGAGTAALAEVIKHSVKSGFGGKVELFALPEAFGFYQKAGFEFDSIIPVYKFHKHLLFGVPLYCWNYIPIVLIPTQ